MTVDWVADVPLVIWTTILAFSGAAAITHIFNLKRYRTEQRDRQIETDLMNLDQLLYEIERIHQFMFKRILSAQDGTPARLPMDELYIDLLPALNVAAAKQSALVLDHYDPVDVFVNDVTDLADREITYHAFHTIMQPTDVDVSSRSRLHKVQYEAWNALRDCREELSAQLSYDLRRRTVGRQMLERILTRLLGDGEA